MENKHLDNARVFKAFCDENRLMILEMLQSGEKCACVLLEKLNIVQSTLSHHMKILVDSGIVSARKEGKWTHYSISSEGVAVAKELLIKLTVVIENCGCINCDCADNSQCK
ncbi:MAG: metalloregulator ArsR/SmtB family transcription factor [Oscillospiraceae bacterium]|nr:metalloregulator ArsR/SmtB family transcription factor [Oscillospiraceae bacterium]